MKRLVLPLLAALSCTAAWSSVDFDNVSSRDDWQELCRQIRLSATKAAQLRDQGVPEDRHLQVTEDVLREAGRGPKTRHAMATLVKGAYQHSELRPKAYGNFSMKICQDMAAAAFPEAPPAVAAPEPRVAEKAPETKPADTTRTTREPAGDKAKQADASRKPVTTAAASPSADAADKARKEEEKKREEADKKRQEDEKRAAQEQQRKEAEAKAKAEAEARKVAAAQAAAQAKMEKERAAREEQARKDRYLAAVAGAMKLRARHCPDGQGEHYIVGLMPKVKPVEVGCIDVHYTEVCPGNVSGSSGVAKNFSGLSMDCFMGDTAQVSPRPACKPEEARVVVDKVVGCQ